MGSYTNSVERCREEGWGPGTIIEAHGQQVRITCVGEELVLGRWRSELDGNVTESTESIQSLMPTYWRRAKRS